jgi:hypothetical protein
MNGSKRNLEEYLRGNSEVSRAYRQLNSPRLPREVDQSIADLAREALSEQRTEEDGRVASARPRMRNINRPLLRKPSWFAPFSAAASVILCAAVLLAIAFDPHARTHKEDKVRILPAVARHEVGYRQLYSSDPPHSRTAAVDGRQLPPMPVDVLRKDPQEWLARIDTLRHTGQTQAAAAELREFRNVFPRYPIPAALQSFR